MNRFSFARLINHSLALSIFAVVAMMLGLLSPLFAPAAHAQTTTGGTVVAWGDNELGQATVPAGLSDVVAIAGGYYHSLALKRDGTVVAWGDNKYGQANVPSSLTDVIAIVAGAFHNLALKRDGTVVAWGDNSDGESNVPEGLTDVIAIAAEGYHSLALKRDGTVVAWGDNRSGQFSVPADLNHVIAISAGEYHSLALKNDGTVVAWGSNNDGQIDVPAGLSDVVAIASGGYHNVALKRDGTVVTWGYESTGFLQPPANLNDVVHIESGSFHSMAFKRDGSFVIWGLSSYAELNVPDGLHNVVALAGGGYHTLAIGQLDTTPPTTTFNQTPATPNANGWYTSDVNVSIKAQDATSEIAETRCVLDPTTVPATFDDLPSGCAYVDGALTVGEGSHQMYAASKDTAGNVEQIQSITIKVDKTAPTVTARLSQNSPSASATITLNASDATSGIASTSYTINGDAPQKYTAPFVFNAVGTYQINYTGSDKAGNSAAVQNITVTVTAPAPQHSQSINLTNAPSSVVENTLESNQYIQLFPERQNYTLPQGITVNDTVIPAGTKVNVYYLHADKVGNDNSAALKLSGSVMFDTKVLAVISDGTTLLNTRSVLGSTTTTYSSSTNQGIEYDDKVTLTGQNQVNVVFNMWSMSDDVRVITLAP